MTAKYLHPVEGSCRRRVTLTPEEYRHAVASHREGERDRAEIERRLAIVRQAKLDHMRAHGELHLPPGVLDSLGIGGEGRRRRRDSIKGG